MSKIKVCPLVTKLGECLYGFLGWHYLFRKKFYHIIIVSIKTEVGGGGAMECLFIKNNCCMKQVVNLFLIL